MYHTNNVVSFAEDILRMQDEIAYLRLEVERLNNIERKYNDLLNSSLRHGQEMSGQVMELILNGGHFRPERAQEQKEKAC